MPSRVAANISVSEFFIDGTGVLLLRSLCWSKPAGDFKFAAHHRGIAAINRQINIFKHDERIRALHIIKEMNEGGPGTLCFNGSINRLMIWRGFPGTNRG